MSELTQEIEKEEGMFVYDKKIECPICNREFTTKVVKTGKARFKGSEMDLRPLYEGVDTIKYDIYMCPHCGYAAVSREFNNVTPSQRKLLKSEIGDKYAGVSDEHESSIYSYDEAIVRYKMALLTALKKPAKLSECAYLCLKLSWLYRSQGEETIEKHYCEKSYKGFEEALQKEYPPICGMDENTVNYLMSVLAYKSGDNEKAMQFGYSVISSRGASTKLKDKEREIIDILKAEKQN